MRPLHRLLPLVLSLFGFAAVSAAADLPYNVGFALDGVTFSEPVAIVSPPGETDRIFVVEKPGRIVVVTNLAQPQSSVFLDITDRIGNGGGERGLLALAFHPEYASNRQFYVWYTSFTSGRTGDDRLARFEATAADPNRADPASEQILFSQPDDASNHNGGQLVFGADGYLYVSLGDEGAANDVLENSQRIDKDLYAGVLRLDVDRRPGNFAPNPHPAVRTGTYSIPRDNPWVGATRFDGRAVDPAKVRTEFWAVGLRNPWRMAFDPETGLLWAGDVGQNLWEEVDVIVRGGNYGWNYREAGIAGPRADPPADATFIDPVWSYPREQGVSITGGFVYRGNRYPDLAGHYLFADYASGRVWALQTDGRNPVGADAVRQIARATAVTTFGLNPANGDILIASQSSNRLLRLIPH